MGGPCGDKRARSRRATPFFFVQYNRCPMPNSMHGRSEQARVAELKRLLTSRRFDSLESLEDVVDAFLWGTENSDPGHEADGSSGAPEHAPGNVLGRE